MVKIYVIILIFSFLPSLAFGQNSGNIYTAYPLDDLIDPNSLDELSNGPGGGPYLLDDRTSETLFLAKGRAEDQTYYLYTAEEGLSNLSDRIRQSAGLDNEQPMRVLIRNKKGDYAGIFARPNSSNGSIAGIGARLREVPFVWREDMGYKELPIKILGDGEYGTGNIQLNENGQIALSVVSRQFIGGGRYQDILATLYFQTLNSSPILIDERIVSSSPELDRLKIIYPIGFDDFGNIFFSFYEDIFNNRRHSRDNIISLGHAVYKTNTPNPTLVYYVISEFDNATLENIGDLHPYPRHSNGLIYYRSLDDRDSDRRLYNGDNLSIIDIYSASGLQERRGLGDTKAYRVIGGNRFGDIVAEDRNSRKLFLSRSGVETVFVEDVTEGLSLLRPASSASLVNDQGSLVVYCGCSSNSGVFLLEHNNAPKEDITVLLVSTAWDFRRDALTGLNEFNGLLRETFDGSSLEAGDYQIDLVSYRVPVDIIDALFDVLKKLNKVVKVGDVVWDFATFHIFDKSVKSVAVREDIQAAYEELIGENIFVNDDVADMRNYITSLLERGKKIVIVAHSDANFLVDLALANEFTFDQLKKIEIVAVGTPARNTVAINGRWINELNDFNVRLYPGSLDANIRNSPFPRNENLFFYLLDEWGHDLVKNYMRPFCTRSAIQAQLVVSIRRLEGAATVTNSTFPVPEYCYVD